MSRIFLAFSCFFRVLFTGKLPVKAMALLPESNEAVSTPKSSPPIKVEKIDVEKPQSPKKPAPTATKSPSKNVATHHKDGAMALLALFQREGRLVAF